MFRPFPQLLKNVRFTGPSPLQSPSVLEARREAEAALGTSGRLVLRASGTEPVVRVMAEAEDEALVTRVVDGLCEAIRTASLAA